jgi:choline dehydrogenase
MIDRVTFEGRRAIGVEISLGGERKRVVARLETILAVGAVGSPAILQRSGIGAAVRLQSLGITTLCDLPGVGGNLHRIRTQAGISRNLNCR